MNTYESFNLACKAVDEARALHDLLVQLGDAGVTDDPVLAAALGDLRTQASHLWSDSVALMTAVSRQVVA